MENVMLFFIPAGWKLVFHNVTLRPNMEVFSARPWAGWKELFSPRSGFFHPAKEISHPAQEISQEKKGSLKSEFRGAIVRISKTGGITSK